MQTNSSHTLDSIRSLLPRMAAGLVIGLCALAFTQSSGCSSDASQADGGTQCVQGSETCDAGYLCTNAICTPTCGSNIDGGTETACAAGFYCEDTPLANNVCSPIQTIYCSTYLDCPAPQECAYGICSYPEVRGDGSSQGCLLTNSVDLCAPDSLCYQVPDTETNQLLNNCIGLGHCSEDGGCPVLAMGTGSVCNQEPDGGMLIPGKERLCLYGFCTTNANCPPDFGCFHVSSTDDLGQCYQGVPGDPCYTIYDCTNSTTGCEYSDGGFADGGLGNDGGILGTCE